MSFFECNLPKIAPKHYKGDKNEFKQLLNGIHERMERLEKARKLANNMRGEEFSSTLQRIFDKDSQNPVFDTFSVEEIAAFALKLYDPSFKSIPNRMDWENVTVMVDTAFITKHEWKALRCLGIGGSDAAVTAGVSPFKIKPTLYYEKTGKEMLVENKASESLEFIFEFGTIMESLVMKTFCNRFGGRVIPETRMFSKKGCPYITANIDGFILMPNGDIFILECKTASYYTKDKWSGNNVPEHYKCQCVHYSLVMSDERIKGVYIACVYGNTLADFVSKPVSTTEDELDFLLIYEQMFWDKLQRDALDELYDEISETDSNAALDTVRRYETGDIDTVNKSEDGANVNDYVGNLVAIQQIDEQMADLKKQMDKLKKERDKLAVPVVRKLEKGKGYASFKNTTFSVTNKGKKRVTCDYHLLRALFPEAAEECLRYKTDKPSFTVNVT